MAQPKLSAEEIATVRALRYDEYLSYEELGKRLGVDQATAHRILNTDGYEFAELTLVRIRKGLARVADAKPRRRERVSA